METKIAPLQAREQLPAANVAVLLRTCAALLVHVAVIVLKLPHGTATIILLHCDIDVVLSPRRYPFTVVGLP